MKKYIIFFFTLLFSQILLSQTLSKDAKIAILTCAPGDELYSQFGHSAIWVFDKQNNIDKVYNYGTFDFNVPNFYLKFARGQLDYKLSVSTFDRFMLEYEYYKRSVTLQELNFDSLQKSHLYNLLETNYLPKNRFYRYDIILDNCATRIRDIINASTNNLIDFKTEDSTKYTYRKILKEYEQNTAWLELGINILLGLPVDKNITTKNTMFMPDYVASVLSNSTLGNKPIILQSRKILAFSRKNTKTLISPLFSFIMLFILVLIMSFYEIKNNKHFKSFDRIFFGILGILGLLLIFLWFGTEHSCTVYNMNLLFAFPLHICAIFFLKQKHKFIRNYFMSIALISAISILLILANILILEFSLVPIFLIIITRAFVISKSITKSQV